MFFFGALFSACEYTPFEAEVVEVSGTVDFEADVAPIFTNAGCNVSSCHGGTQNPNLSESNAFQSLTSNPKYTDLNDPNNIHEKAKPGNTHSANYSSEQAAFVLKWIEQYNEEN